MDALKEAVALDDDVPQPLEMIDDDGETEYVGETEALVEGFALTVTLTLCVIVGDKVVETVTETVPICVVVPEIVIEAHFDTVGEAEKLPDTEVVLVAFGDTDELGVMEWITEKLRRALPLTDEEEQSDSLPETVGLAVNETVPDDDNEEEDDTELLPVTEDVL